MGWKLNISTKKVNVRQRICTEMKSNCKKDRIHYYNQFKSLAIKSSIHVSVMIFYILCIVMRSKYKMFFRYNKLKYRLSMGISKMI